MEVLNLFINIGLIILGFGLLIFVHELGHFLAAKWANIRTEAFAVGMGPVMVAWRKGIGFAPGSTHHKVVERTGKPAHELSDGELEQHGLGETEYSLRWLPIGGFVKMLGQEDVNPSATSEDPRSYNVCPIGKRMIVVSAGVIMNVLLAAVLFIVAFQVGVRFEAPLVGSVDPTMPAATTMPDNANALGITEPGLQPGDRVLQIAGRDAKTFADVQIGSAMSRPDVPLTMMVERSGYDAPLEFTMQPRRDERSGLFSIGVAPASSTQLIERDRGGQVSRFLHQAGLADQGIEPGMKLIEANGQRLHTFDEFNAIVDTSNGEAIDTRWANLDADGEPIGDPVYATINVEPQLQILRYPERTADGARNIVFGLFGMTPLTKITSIQDGSPNAGVLEPNDAVLRFDSLHGPRFHELLDAIRAHEPGPVEMQVVRDGDVADITAEVVRSGYFDGTGRLGVGVGMSAHHVPYMAESLTRIAVPVPGERDPRIERTPVYDLDLLPGSRFEAVKDMAVNNWSELRKALRQATRQAHDRNDGANVNLTVVHPTREADRETVTMELSAADVEALHALGWESELSAMVFEPIYTVRSSDGNPFLAVWMGVEETHKILMLTYLTIDRLFRRTVGVEQLRGPVGIVHIGATIADRGLMYLIFFLAVISVNLAVINFLPLPIVDGGLFLFLVYEKITGKPPSVLFQNIVTILGIALIATIFIVVTYHDIMRLITGEL